MEKYKFRTYNRDLIDTTYDSPKDAIEACRNIENDACEMSVVTYDDRGERTEKVIYDAEEGKDAGDCFNKWAKVTGYESN